MRDEHMRETICLVRKEIAISSKDYEVQCEDGAGNYESIWRTGR